MLAFILLGVVFQAGTAWTQSGARLGAEACARLIDAADGGRYQPGVDARGRAVAPANLQANPTFETPTAIEFDLIVPNAELRGGDGHRRWPLRPRRLRPEETHLEGKLGRITFDLASGTLSYNGRPFYFAATAPVLDNCRRLLAQPAGTFSPE